MNVEKGWKINFPKENVPSFDTKNGEFFSSSALRLQFCRNKKRSNRKGRKVDRKKAEGLHVNGGRSIARLSSSPMPSRRTVLKMKKKKS
jgi:hypothetical protein